VIIIQVICACCLPEKGLDVICQDIHGYSEESFIFRCLDVTFSWYLLWLLLLTARRKDPMGWLSCYVKGILISWGIFYIRCLAMTFFLCISLDYLSSMHEGRTLGVNCLLLPKTLMSIGKYYIQMSWRVIFSWYRPWPSLLTVWNRESVGRIESTTQVAIS
jgi:hypothetical protein